VAAGRIGIGGRGAGRGAVYVSTLGIVEGVGSIDIVGGGGNCNVDMGEGWSSLVLRIACTRG